MCALIAAFLSTATHFSLGYRLNFLPSRSHHIWHAYLISRHGLLRLTLLEVISRRHNALALATSKIHFTTMLVEAQIMKRNTCLRGAYVDFTVHFGS